MYCSEYNSGALPLVDCSAIARSLASVGEVKPQPASGLASCHRQLSHLATSQYVASYKLYTNRVSDSRFEPPSYPISVASELIKSAS